MQNNKIEKRKCKIFMHFLKFFSFINPNIFYT